MVLNPYSHHQGIKHSYILRTKSLYVQSPIFKTDFSASTSELLNIIIKRKELWKVMCNQSQIDSHPIFTCLLLFSSLCRSWCKHGNKQSLTLTEMCRNSFFFNMTRCQGITTPVRLYPIVQCFPHSRGSMLIPNSKQRLFIQISPIPSAAQLVR